MTGLRDEGLEAFAQMARAPVEAGEVPGLVALVAHGDEVHVEVVGSQAFGGAPMRRDSQFRIASVTKPVTAAVVLTLVGEGLVSLEEPVDGLVPELAGRRVLRRLDGPLDDVEPASRPVTVRDLLTFTFGFGMATEFFSAPDDWPILRAVAEAELHTLGPPRPEAQPAPDVWLERLGALPLLAQPGARWLYNTGASVLGVLAARVAGTDYGGVVAQRLLEPLGMSDTALWACDTSRLVTAYVPTRTGLEVHDPPDGAWSAPPAFGDGAAGLVSTADDLLAFARMLLHRGGGLIPPALVEEMTRDQLTDAQREGAGPILGDLGWSFCQAVVTSGPRRGAYGWNGGFGTSWLVDPIRDLVVIVLAQRLFETATLPRLHAALQDAAYRAAGAESDSQARTA